MPSANAAANIPDAPLRVIFLYMAFLPDRWFENIYQRILYTGIAGVDRLGFDLN